jgi:hypothetical protein
LELAFLRFTQGNKQKTGHFTRLESALKESEECRRLLVWHQKLASLNHLPFSKEPNSVFRWPFFS